MKNFRTHVHTLSALAAAVVATACFACSARGQGLLDQQLGPATPSTPAPAVTPDAATKPPAPAEQAAPKPIKPNVGGTDIISPDAAKKVDDQDLLHQLVDPNATPPGDKVTEQLQEMLDRMGQSQKLLSDKKDPGEITQETQRRILTDLDVLIELAKKSQQSGSSNQKPDPKDPSQQPPEKQYSNGQQPGNSQGGTTAATGDNPTSGQSTADTGDIRNKGNGESWGNLRATERSLISHGANEAAISAYSDMIDRYYQALAELGKARNR